MPFAQRTFLQHTTFGQEYAASLGCVIIDHATPRDVDWHRVCALSEDHCGGVVGSIIATFISLKMSICVVAHLRGGSLFSETVIQHAHGKESARIPVV